MKRSPDVNPLHELKGQELPIDGKGGRAGIGLAALFASVSHLPDKMSSYPRRTDIPAGLPTRGLEIGMLTGLVAQRPDVSPASLSTGVADLSAFFQSTARQEMSTDHRRQMMVRSIGESEIRGTPHVIYVSEGFKRLMALSGPFGKVERHPHIALDKFQKASKSMTKKWQKAMKKQAKAFTL